MNASEDEKHYGIQLPKVPAKPAAKEAVPYVTGATFQVVILAIATTAVDIYTAEVCQIGLYAVQSGLTWCQCILPKGDFHPRASEINGFYIGTQGDKRVLMKKNVKDAIKTFKKKKVMKAFHDFITAIKEWILLVVYNDQYDIPILFRTLEECEISPTFLETCSMGIFDALRFLKSVQKVELPGIENLQQITVFKYLFPQTEGEKHVHDVNGDIGTLYPILYQSKLAPFEPDSEKLRKFSSTFRSAFQTYTFNRERHDRMETLKLKLLKEHWARHKGVSQNIVKKIAESGLEYRHLKLVYKTKGVKGLEELLKDRVKLRIDTIAKVITVFRKEE